ncbi:hypothetical protein AG1IA_06291 [Rhizoctonia solani AG-1 IA]|uniref:Uncharacterized protein n=1 Tax=Thanatephorus cucumeris (strain AG1-IA) TaxID=983506 RepID=L8WNW9_THACA|nr:hypothetical protein AG1IA_06291 [Rhizoctonia solani AG-1 IA]
MTYHTTNVHAFCCVSYDLLSATQGRIPCNVRAEGDAGGIWVVVCNSRSRGHVGWGGIDR